MFSDDPFINVFIILLLVLSLAIPVTLFNRVNNHFTGKGNGDVYFDYRLGDQFTIKMIPLETSGFSDLDSLERYFISYYDAFENGYNKTRGNR